MAELCQAQLKLELVYFGDEPAHRFLWYPRRSWQYFFWVAHLRQVEYFCCKMFVPEVFQNQTSYFGRVFCKRRSPPFRPPPFAESNYFILKSFSFFLYLKWITGCETESVWYGKLIWVFFTPWLRREGEFSIEKGGWVGQLGLGLGLDTNDMLWFPIFQMFLWNLRTSKKKIDFF